MGMIQRLSIGELHAFELTETSRTWLVERPIQIAVYVVLAIVLRFAAHRLIDRMTRPRSSGTPPLLRPLQERAPRGLKDPVVAERRAQRARTIGSVLKSTVSIVVLVWVVLQILGTLGVNVTPFIASAGIIGVALGFGAQNLVRDFLSGIFMLLEDQYGVGDVVDLGEATGTVESVGLRVTTIRDVGGTLWYCRNGEIIRVGNMSQGYAVAVVDLPIAHAANVHRACEVALRAVLESARADAIVEDVLDEPEMLGVNSVTAESVMLRITAKVKPGRQWAVQRAFTRAALVAFEQDDVEAPYVSVLTSSRNGA
ncbi:mechanosensitive ion channel family protein [Rhodococcus triatomae]|uniref:Small conductance mechanosensitive channel n=2 Tax=Rhodococcus triatomae TaxID=300028 RepID=A0A1G8AQC9_9NOCA|nr:mechanosensitive ion channel family protein [Rhodococcus triatomae]QNG17700.1 mechanosensitive ion channel family protein [Rhodococcus triatomae]QNG22633.1 mechanosensitive ion channel family protein [Rhodococcus triatomae]SDH23168.1 small conductance mechanosensitive channel [Rhodococcus triatomae]